MPQIFLIFERSHVMAKHKEIIIPKTLAEHPRYVEASDRLADLQKQLTAVEAEIASLPPNRSDSEVRMNRLISSYVTGQIATMEPQEVDSLIEKRDALQTAVGRLTSQLNSLRIELAEQIYTAHYSAEHKAKRRRIAEAIIELARALNDEREFAQEMFQAGALYDSSYGHRLFVNLSQCPKLLQLFRYLPGEREIGEFTRDNKNLLQ
jgi:hypothetical protein